MLGEKPLNEITRKDVKDFINDKLKDGLRAGTVRNLKAYLSCILSEAVDDELIETNPALRTGRLIKKKDDSEDELAEIAPLTWEEKTRLEETLQKHYPAHYPLFLVRLILGIPIGLHQVFLIGEMSSGILDEIP